MANLQLPGGDAPGVDMVVDREIPSIRFDDAIRDTQKYNVGSADFRAKCKVLVELWPSFVIEGLITSDGIIQKLCCPRLGSCLKFKFDGRDRLTLHVDLYYM